MPVASKAIVCNGLDFCHSARRRFFDHILVNSCNSARMLPVQKVPGWHANLGDINRTGFHGCKDMGQDQATGAWLQAWQLKSVRHCDRASDDDQTHVRVHWLIA